MARKPINSQTAARRLLDALRDGEPADTFGHAEAHELLPRFVDDERAGVDVDAEPAYAALLRHLDTCDDCAALYSELSENLEALTGAAGPLPESHATAPTFFGQPQPQHEDWPAVRVFKGLTRRFEMPLPIKRLGPKVGTYGAEEQIELFNDSIDDLPGQPYVVVKLLINKGGSTLRLLIREPRQPPAHWQVELRAGDTVALAVTDQYGNAQFNNLPVEGLDKLMLRYSEVPAASA